MLHWSSGRRGFAPVSFGDVDDEPCIDDSELAEEVASATDECAPDGAVFRAVSGQPRHFDALLTPKTGPYAGESQLPLVFRVAFGANYGGNPPDVAYAGQGTLLHPNCGTFGPGRLPTNEAWAAKVKEAAKYVREADLPPGATTDAEKMSVPPGVLVLYDNRMVFHVSATTVLLDLLGAVEAPRPHHVPANFMAADLWAADPAAFAEMAKACLAGTATA